VVPDPRSSRRWILKHGLLGRATLLGRTLLGFGPIMARRDVFMLIAGFACTCAANDACAEDRRHDGFHFSFELGAGEFAYAGTRTEAGDARNASMKAVAVFGGLLFGGTIAEGWVVGGGSQGHVVYGAELEADGYEGNERNLQLGLMGPYATFYPDDRGGLFVRFLSGIAYAVGDDARVANGWGATGSVGYGWWTSEEWSVELVARTSFARVRYEGERRNRPVEAAFDAWLPGLLVAFTYH